MEPSKEFKIYLHYDDHDKDIGVLYIDREDKKFHFCEESRQDSDVIFHLWEEDNESIVGVRIILDRDIVTYWQDHPVRISMPRWIDEAVQEWIGRVEEHKFREIYPPVSWPPAPKGVPCSTWFTPYAR
jgi:hypothetical protein